MARRKRLRHIGELLKGRRIQRGLSQRELAALVDLPQSHLSKIETGAVDLRVSSLQKLAEALGLHITVMAAPEVVFDSPPGPAAPAGPTAAAHAAAIAKDLGALRRLRPVDAGLRSMAAALETLAGGALFVSGVDQLEEQVSAAAGDGQIPDLVADQQRGVGIWTCCQRLEKPSQKAG